MTDAWIFSAALQMNYSLINHPCSKIVFGLRIFSIAFGARMCARGGLGTFPTAELMPLALAHACRLAKYGALGKNR